MDEPRKCLPLKQDVIYGPVHSRRLGESLGLNISPTGRKICSFNCVYCHFGWTDKVTLRTEDYADEFPPPSKIFDALAKYLQLHPKPDYITFSGNGEATTHPRFGEIVDGVIEIRNRIAPDVQVTILSNSSTAGDPEVLKALRKLDIRFMKLDCGDQETFRRFNRAGSGLKIDDIVGYLQRMDMPIIIQTLLADGNGGNYNQSSIDGYVSALKAIKPESVQLYSLDRPTPDGSLVGLSSEQLNELAERVKLEAGIDAHIFGPREDLTPEEWRKRFEGR